MYRTLIDCLEALTHSDKGICFVEGSDVECFLTFGEIGRSARSILHNLRRRGIEPGDELVFQLEDNKVFIQVFWACLLGNIVPIPLSIGRNMDQRLKLLNVWKQLRKPSLASTSAYLERIERFSDSPGRREELGDIREKLISIEELLEDRGTAEPYPATAESIAYVQFSSGSTADPKGVVLTHENILTNIQAILQGIRSPAEGDLFFSWMPLTHDMGLIGFHLTPLVAGWTHYIMPTDLFIRRPFLWLQKIAEHKITFSASPNFGYSYLLERCGTGALPEVDLSSLRIITNGAEPISARLCSVFTDRFSQYGLRDNVIFPVYGLAEASLAVTFSEPEAPVQSLRLDRGKLNENDKVVAVGEDADGALFVNVGRPVAGCQVKVVNRADRQEIAQGQIGLICIKGKNVTSGYYRNPAASLAAFLEEDWLITGDLGFINEDCLYIVGRVKDVIFRNGQNLYPFDLEQAAEQATALGTGKIVVAGLSNKETLEDHVVVFVLHKAGPEDFIAFEMSIRKAINSYFGFEIHEVLPVREIPKTTSGKVQRYKLLEKYKRGDFNETRDAIDAIRRLRSGGSAVPPANGVEQTLLEIWEAVLKTSGFGVTDEFFTIGGNSLKGSWILARIAERFGVDISYKELLGLATIRDQAVLLEKLSGDSFYAIVPDRRPTPYPLSSAQERLYYFWEIDKTSTAYNIPVALSIEGRLDVDGLKQAFKKVAGRQDALRTVFQWRDNVPLQSFSREAVLEWQVLPIEREAVEERLKQLVRPFDLHRLPLFRLALLQIGEEESILFLDFHHIIMDGLSVAYFVEEAFNYYAGGQPAELAVRYPDYLAWEASRMDSFIVREQEKFWRDQLGGAFPVLSIPTDFPRPAVLTHEGRKLPVELTGDLASRLRKLAQEKQTTMALLFFAAYAILLSKYSNQEDLVIGVPVAGRRNAGADGLIGMFVKNLAIRCRPEGGKRLGDLLREVREIFVDAYDNQDYPFGEIVGKMAGRRVAGHNALFDTMFIFQNMPLPEIAGIRVKRRFFDPEVAKYDLSLEVFEEDDMIRLYLEYRTALFTADTACRVARHYVHLLGEMAENPDALLCDVSLADKREREELIHGLNATQKAYPEAIRVETLFEEQVRKTPLAPAVYDRDIAVSYDELNGDADRMARMLVERRVAAGKPVAILLERSVGYITAILGILKAGRCYLPLDAGWPAERIAWLLGDSGADCLITDRRSYDRLISATAHELPRQLILSDELTPAGGGGFAGAADRDPLAYIMYTSGTTGNPKGVLIGHRSLTNYLLWAVEEYVKEERAVFPFFTSPAFDLTVTSVFVPLISGGAIVVYPESGPSIPVLQVFGENKVTIVKLTPAHLRMLWTSRELLDLAASSVRTLIVGGEQLEAGLCGDIHRRFDGKVEVFNEYGPTEATVGCIVHQYDPEEDLTGAVPIGRPIANTQVYLLDRYLRPVAGAIEGEIFIAGRCLATGYRAQTEDATHKFPGNPFSPGEKMYRTGDIAQRLSNGELSFIGRVDGQVKINGYRIELKEIETALLQQGSISEAAVISRMDKQGDRHLHAFYTVCGEDPGGRLKSYLAGKLPGYMIPAYFTLLAQIPLNSNGKIDHKALAALDVSPARAVADDAAVADSRAAADEVEGLAARIWAEVLNVADVGRDENFFDLGGDSIKAVQITARFHQRGFSIAPKDILTHQTIAGIAGKVNRTDAAPSGQQLVVGTKGFTPIESWFFGQGFPDPDAYTQSALLRFDDTITVAAFTAAFGKLIAYHDALRLNYDKDSHALYFNNELLSRHFPIGYFTLGDGVDGDKVVQIREIAAQCRKEITISNGFPVNVVVIKEPDGPQLLLIAIHHLAVDGISWRILLADLYQLLRPSSSQKEAELPRKTASLKDWYAALDGFWESLRADHDNRGAELPAFSIPQDMETNDWRTVHSTRMHFNIPEEATGFLLKEANRVYNTDTHILLVVALVRTLFDWTKGEAVVITLEHHGRQIDGIDVSRTMGWFTTFYPEVFSCRDMDLPDQMRYIKNSMKKDVYKGLKYGLAKYFRKPLVPSGGPVELQFNYLGSFGTEIDNELFHYVEMDTGENVGAENPMTARIGIDCMIVRNQLSFTLQYNRMAHRRETLDNLKEGLLREIGALMTHLKAQKEVFFTSSDFAAAALREEELKLLFE